MSSSNFVHLHSHTEYSLLDGASKIGSIANAAAEWQMPAVAMTDHGNLFGAIDFYRAMKDVDVKPILGCEVYCAIESRFSKKPARGVQSGSNHLVLLAQNEVGYKNLVKLVSAGYLEGFYYAPRIDKTILRKYGEGLICLSACVSGEIPHLIEREGIPAAVKAVEEYQDIFGDNFYLEIQRHGIDKELKINDGLLKLHKEMGVPLVATNDSHFLRPDDHEAHAALVAIQTGKTLDDPNRMCYPTGVYFKSADEMYELFHDLPNACERTLEIAEKCDFEMSFDESHAPDFPLPEGFDDPLTFLEHRARIGLEGRIGKIKPEYEERLKFELNVIQQTGYPGYFLILDDLVTFCKAEGIRAGGRGSAVSSLVGWALGITTVDPIEYGLVFERFLNPERISPPDIDYDIADKDRERVIEYVVEKYGRDNVCQIVTFGTMGAKAVIRDVGRVMNLPFGDVDKIAKLIPAELKMTIDKAIDQCPELKTMSEDGQTGEKLLKIARQLEGMARHCSIHAAAVVIAPKLLTELMPLYKAPKGGEVMTMYNWHHVEDLGFLKMDFLGLRNLSVIDDAVQMLKENRDLDLEIDNLPLDDADTYALFGNGDTTGVFQFESAGMKGYLTQLNPDKIGDIIAMNALYRPGPMKYIPNYIDRKNGKEEVVFYDEKMKPALEETYGIITYQEQVQRLCRDLAGFTLGKADGIRKAMGKKLAEVMEQYKAEFMDGCAANDVPRSAGEKIWADIEVFSGYGFNKAHSSGYSMVAYQCAYLKAHYPSEFMAANLNSEIGDIERLTVLIDECRKMDIEVRGPDVNHSGVRFRAIPDLEGDTKGSVSMGMTAVRNVGQGAVEGIVAAREGGEAFDSLFDLCERVDLRAVNRRALEALINAGAMDELDGNRAQLMAVLDRAMEMAQNAQQDKIKGQFSLFGGEGMEDQAAIVSNTDLPELEPWIEKELLAREKEVLGFYMSGHPLDKYREDLANIGIRASSDLEGLPDGAEIQLGGMINEVKLHTDRNGRQMAFGSIEDMNGSVELVVFPDAFERVKDKLEVDALVMLHGRLSDRNSRISVQVEQLMELDEARVEMADAVNVLLAGTNLMEDKLTSLKDIAGRHLGGCSLFIHVQIDDGNRAVIRARDLKVSPTEEFLTEINDMTGARTWISSDRAKHRAPALPLDPRRWWAAAATN
jgi:DNA polymerase-3 subunit alpha